MSKHTRRLLLALAAATLAADLGTNTQAARAQAHEQAAVREIEIIVDGGYKPNRIEIHEGERVRLKFVRKEHNACSKEVVFPSLGIRRELPPDQPVWIELPALRAGQYEFRCGMNMIRGTLVVTRAA